MKMQCRVCPDAAIDEIPMRSEDRHTKSITVSKIINPGSIQLIVAYDTRDCLNDSYNLQCLVWPNVGLLLVTPAKKGGKENEMTKSCDCDIN